MRKYWIMWTIAVVCLGCEPRPLERADVPINLGMRLNEASDVAQLSPNFAELRTIRLRNLILELPLAADSTALPKVTVDIPGDTKALLDIYRIHLQLAFCNNNEEELFPIGRPADLTRWFARLDSEIRRNLNQLKGFPIERVVVGGALLQVSKATAEWNALLTALRKDYPGMLFSVGGRTELLENSELGKISDELTIDYAPMAGKELKAESRTENQRIAALAEQLGKPVFIYRANIIGDDPLIQLKNRLRFWPDAVNLSGLCINSLYANIPTRDDHTYYGVQDNPEVMEYLEEYRANTLK